MIYGERIRLRALTREDLPLFVTWLNDPEVTHGLTHYQSISPEDEEKWFEGVRAAPLVERPLMIEIPSETEGWEPIGNCSLMDVDWRVRQAEFGIVIGAKQHWSKGYGAEVLRLMLRHAFETLNLHRVYLRVFENNPRAIRSYEKAGLQVEGRLRHAHYHAGEYVDVLMMSILRPEWEAAQSVN